MTSGIYEYKFDNGESYIGQAIDIEKRWEQHIQKMQAGKHTKKIQAAYDEQGLPDFKILLECHAHYLDAMETLFINRFSPVLNSAIPRCEDELHDFDVALLQASIYEVLGSVNCLKEEAAKVPELEARLLVIAKEAQPREIQEYIYSLETDADFLATQLKIAESVKSRQYMQLKVAEDRIAQYNTKSWFYRLFNRV